MSKVYVDNAHNRRRGRVGMPLGSMPEKAGDRAAKNGPIVRSQSGQQPQSPVTRTDTPQNKKPDHKEISKGSKQEPKLTNSSGDRSGIRNRDKGDAGSTRAAARYDNKTSKNSSVGHSPHDNVHTDTGIRSKVKVDKQQNNTSVRSDKKHVESTESESVNASPAAARQPRLYKDNPLNRRLKRVGLPIGTAVYFAKTKTVGTRSYENTSTNRILERVGKPRGCMPLKSSTTKKIPEMLKRIDDEDEFKEFVFEDRSECNGDLEFGLLDSHGERIDAFDQALYRYNRQKEEQSWKRTTKEPPKTQVAMLKDYRGKKIKFDEVKLHNVIGKGGFGLVYFAKWNDTVVAVKKLQNEKISNSRIKDFAREMMKFCTLNDPNIVKFIGACVEKSNLCIVMEYMQMTLYDAVHIRNDTDFSETEQIDVLQQVCNGMEYLHSKRIVHCDLKTPNILLDYVKGEICEVKITDFGLSMIIHDTSVSVEELVKNIGTPQYSPPEMLRGEILSAKDMMRADIYSLALIFLEVIFKEEPFPDYSYQQLKKEVGEGRAAPEIPEYPVLDRSIKNILQQALSYEPTDRPSVARICEILRDKHTLSGS